MEHTIAFNETLRVPTRYGEFVTNHIEFCANSFPRSVHKHNSYELLYIVSGKVKLNISNTQLLMLSNNVILIQPDTVHEILPDKGTEYFIMHFSSALQNMIKSSNAEKSLFLRMNYAASDDYKQLIIWDKTYANITLQQIKQEIINKTWGYKLVVGNSCAILLYLILRNLPAKEFKGKDFRDLPASPNLAVQIYTYIRTHLESSPSLDDVAAEFHISSRQANRILNEFYNQSYKTILNSVRLNKAKELLEATKLSLDEIAVQIGYDSSKSLYNLFKKYENCSPAEYRSNLKET